MLNPDMKSIIQYCRCIWLKCTQNGRLCSRTATDYFDKI